MQKLTRTLSAAEKPRKLIHHMPVFSHFDDQFRRLIAAVDAIAGWAGAAAVVIVPGRSAMAASPPTSSSAVAP
ncbi:hypothetical protein [Bradyrhizobium lablabi]|uniref:hypothetical protein n=1 Tax=Bradyrhizobium lablabi TaxID=722472 RepID=UPI0012AC44DC|nr:hypothetical protein [Bradyrhizobium lablabi]